MNWIVQSVPKIVALITVRSNTGSRAYVGHTSRYMRYDLKYSTVKEYKNNFSALRAFVLPICIEKIFEPSFTIKVTPFIYYPCYT